MLRKLLCTATFLFSLVSLSMAQTGAIEGTVTDSKTGDTVLAANIFLQDINRGAATNAQGVYSISNVPEGTYTMRVTYVGYETYKEQVTITANETLEKDIELKPKTAGLDEVVVTGYGKTQKKEITGSIASVSSDEFEDAPVQNSAGVLQGRAAGVQVTSPSGTPGAGFEVQIRGQGSINSGTRPLYIVDGVQMSYSNRNGTNSNSPLNAIPPENIESIEVLKDAASAAIYGSQAANGVVLITTKSGRAGDTKVTASVQRGVTTRIKNNDYFNRNQFGEFFKAALAYDNPGASSSQVNTAFKNQFFPAYGFSPSKSLSDLPNTDWFDYTSRRGVSTNYSASVSGGTKKSTYRVSATLDNEDGYLRGNNYQNYSLNGNFTQQVSSKLQTHVKVNLSKQDFEGPCQDGFFGNCPVSASAFILPIAQPYNDDGSYSNNFPFVGRDANPAKIFNGRTRRTEVLQIVGNIGADYDVTDWLTIGTQISMDYRREDERSYRNTTVSPDDGGSLLQISAPTSNLQGNVTANFDHTFKDVHNVSGTLGAEYRRDYTRQIAARGIGFPNDLFKQLNSVAEPTAANGFTNEFRRAGYFGKVKYNFDEKYFASFTARYDGDSRFGGSNKWGFFPGGSVGWDISQEDFLEADFVDQLKIRASYGVVGTSQIGRYASRGLYGTTTAAYKGTTGLRPTQLANQQLTWEESTTINFGVDYSLFGNRVTGSVDVYQKDNSSLLLDQPLPSDSGFGSISKNVGKVRNKGFEFSVQTINIQTKDFMWSTRFNIGINTNEVRELSSGNDALNPNGIQPVEVGHPINAWKVVQYAGVNPADGRPFWYDKNNNLTYDPDTIEDRKFNDSSGEDAVGGFGTHLQYKGFDLKAFFQYSIGQRANPSQITAFGIAQVGGSQTNGLEERLTKAWRKPGDVKPYPAPTTGFTYPNSGAGYFLTSSDKLYDTTYLRLKNVRLAYNLPNSLTEKANIGNVQVYVTGLNLVTWTGYIGFDPEVAGDETQASIPVGRSFQGGIRVQF